ncbi:MAG: hypothetical protein IH845_00420 [Nanoarchaeota archaeon]|nr:hypothetical protein [Nanoarchaeota archaeon]
MVSKKIDFSWWPFGFFFGVFIVFINIMILYNGGFSHSVFHMIFHALIAFLCFGILLFSLRLNESAIKYIFAGVLIGIIVETSSFILHLFGEYYFLSSNPLKGSIWIVSILLIMEGFKEAVK